MYWLWQLGERLLTDHPQTCLKKDPYVLIYNFLFFFLDYSSDYKRGDSSYNDRTGQLVTRKKRRSTIESIKGIL